MFALLTPPLRKEKAKGEERRGRRQEGGKALKRAERVHEEGLGAAGCPPQREEQQRAPFLLSLPSKVSACFSFYRPQVSVTIPHNGIEIRHTCDAARRKFPFEVY